MSGFRVKNGETFLFIGDSITDCHRRTCGDPFGQGYVRLFIDMVTARYPGRRIKFLNMGCGGQNVRDLKDRWEDDVINRRPDWLVILVGANDLYYLLYNAAAPVTPEIYAENYDYILSVTAKRLKKCRVILMDPFYISQDNSGQTFRSKFLEKLPEYINVVHQMSARYKTRLIMTHKLFQSHLRYCPADTLCAEPVHPNATGHLIIANALFDLLTK